MLDEDPLDLTQLRRAESASPLERASSFLTRPRLDRSVDYGIISRSR
jgi:hypothetical protein